MSLYSFGSGSVPETAKNIYLLFQNNLPVHFGKYIRRSPPAVQNINSCYRFSSVAIFFMMMPGAKA